MLDLIFIFLGGMLCSASIILVLFQKPKVIDRYTIRIVDERKKNASKQRSVRKTTKQLDRPKEKQVQ